MCIVFRHGYRGFVHASILLLFQFVFGLAAPLAAQEAATQAPPAKVQQLIELLDDPDVRQWLAAKQTTATAAVMPPAGHASRLVAGIRRHLSGMRQAIPRVVPEWIAARERIAHELKNGVTRPIVWGLSLVLIIGYAAEFLTRYALRRSARRNAAQPGRGLAAFIRIAPLVVFAIAAVAAFAHTGWPSHLEAAVAPLVIAWIGARLLSAVASAAMESRYTGNGTAEGRAGAPVMLFWYRRSVSLIYAMAFTWAVVDMMQALALPADVRDLTAAVLGLVVLGMAIDAVVRRPVVELTVGRRITRNSLIIASLALLWLFWAAGMKVLFWVGVFALILPPLLRFTTAATRSMLDTEAADYARVMRNVLVDRGVRFLIVALVVAWLAIVFQLHGSPVIQGDVAKHIFRGVLAGVIILLAADLVWQLAKEFINLHLKRAIMESVDSAQIARNMRVRTLLPILRNFLAVFIAIVAGMMVFSSLGVHIGPLIAGAGVFGVAIGFGSQTLVKDIISGIFYMMDDAFRVGEYIQSGSYMGTVESFSIRSVRLRHHRGPVFTVPFGSLGAVQNMSRDWVIDKFTINVAYDSDVAKVKKVVKGVGATLLEDPELGPLIIETVKMKGVEQFGDYGITLGFAMTTKPGHQTQVRRRAQALIKDAFKTHGIHFASPTVQVAGDEAQSSMAAAAMTRDTIAKKNAALAAQQGGETAAG
ncbi:mechanosensitive ion channel [Sinorhizobium meliloti]|uniref:mechanosensitive ion channel family protein n=1 Tax=Rhizobium meliloti TaxID=382 RepID=UPI000B499EAC|nr:mechanosensitive ion channel family protein [Sinorhizobium meliloti]ASQ06420.1 mechanosensitive ion channel family protein [Sinorhizobium meliloti]MDW9794893.1 mechanosensitive ion channel [Sinorhizobium meliloti]MDX0064515.1 mechanosensitive ion channel [Sinorhizobium meliloti]MDX0082586.1 mechanosensitive ion channel [Sinorhizobium meliloti]MQU72486.1 mechanosensitive ion channel [Sinorhizobium meliloti]